MTDAAATRHAQDRWRGLLAGRAIPDAVLAVAPGDPYRQLPERFAAAEVPDDTPSRRAGLALLGEAGGTVLDVGCGAGAASLALGDAVTHVTGVDDATDMLAAFTRACLERDVPWQGVLGAWPEVAVEAGQADVVLAHHLVYDVAELSEFVAALDRAARRGVVVELTEQHPCAWQDPLWRRFHGLDRPAPPTAHDAIAVISEVLDAAPHVERWMPAASRATGEPDEEHLRLLCDQLCVPTSRADEVAAAVRGLEPDPSGAVTVSWSATHP